jgi:hypothetical protein
MKLMSNRLKIKYYFLHLRSLFGNAQMPRESLLVDCREVKGYLLLGYCEHSAGTERLFNWAVWP